MGEVESPGQDSESLSSPSSTLPLVEVTLSDWCIINFNQCLPNVYNMLDHAVQTSVSSKLAKASLSSSDSVKKYLDLFNLQEN